LVKKNPNNTDLKQRFTQLKSKTSSDRIGVNYSYTHFSRESVGPWQITGLQYIRERKNLTLIGRVNYADRQSDGNIIASGIQYELESYVQHNQKSYSYASASFSDAIVFPKLKLSYSYFRNFNKGWEADLGTRYTKAADDEIYTAVAGIGKYVGSYWLNLKSYLQFSENDVNPSVTATARYYFNTKYDYATVLLGYGSSPDERVSLVDLEQRITLRSYRVGAGYYKLFNEHYVTGVLATFNNQEYTANLTQNELEVFVTLQYKF
jgi:YaiO family outer membrane protein